jgi:hypothetical protein
MMIWGHCRCLRWSICRPVSSRGPVGSVSSQYSVPGRASSALVIKSLAVGGLSRSSPPRSVHPGSPLRPRRSPRLVATVLCGRVAPPGAPFLPPAVGARSHGTSQPFAQLPYPGSEGQRKSRLSCLASFRPPLLTRSLPGHPFERALGVRKLLADGQQTGHSAADSLFAGHASEDTARFFWRLDRTVKNKQTPANAGVLGLLWAVDG